ARRLPGQVRASVYKREQEDVHVHAGKEVLICPGLSHILRQRESSSLMFKTRKKSKKEKESVRETVALVQPGMFDVVVSMSSDVGCVRELNEDSGTYIQP